MITLNITSDQIKRAEELYEFHNIKNSITKGKSEIFGALGEIVVLDYFKQEYETDHTQDYDFDMEIDSHKVEVKTKKTTVTPRPNYFCSVTNYNTTQKCDFYFFVRIREDLKTAYLLGYMSPESFYKKAVFKKKGEKDTNNFVFKSDCYNLPVSGLNKFTPISSSKT